MIGKPIPVRPENLPSGTGLASPGGAGAGSPFHSNVPVVTSQNSIVRPYSCMWPPMTTILPSTAGLPSYERSLCPGDKSNDLSPTGNATSSCQGQPDKNGHGRPSGT